jgi:DNA (cytosine-5)-methyltransferase 1
MKFISLCAGIEAASVALGVLGWQAIAFAEIEPFPCAVLAHHYPHVPNLGDMTGWRTWPEALLLEIEAVLGGTPCQAFSVAGLRESLGDDRGNLTLTYVEIIEHIDALRARHGRPPLVCLWENVPGVLSTVDNAFGCFLGRLAGEVVPLTPPGGRWTDAGYVRGPARAIAWRTLDAQYFGLAQRRERVFALASARADFRPEAVLFESARVRRDHPPRRQPGERPAPTLSSRTKGGGGLGTDFDLDGGLIAAEVAPTIDASFGRLQGCSGQDLQHGHSHLVAGTVSAKWAKWAKGSGGPSGDECQNLVPVAFSHQAAGTQTTLGFDPESGTCPALIKGQTPAVAFTCFDTTHITSAENRSNPQPGDPCHPLTKKGHPPLLTLAIRGRGGESNLEIREDESANAILTPNGGRCGIGCGAVAYTLHGTDGTATIASETEVCTALRTKPPGSIENSSTTVAVSQMCVRRLTPRECERLQGFPDDYTRIPGWSGWRELDTEETPDELRAEGLLVKQTKSGRWWVNDPDGPRYKALGNSWAVNVVRWIGTRINAELSHTLDVAA